MNNEHDSGFAYLDRPTEGLARQLVGAATGRTSIPLRLIDFCPSGHGLAADAEVTLELNGAAQRYALEARGRVRSREEVRAIAARNRTSPFPLLLATTYLTLALAEACVERDLQFMDLAGNVHIHLSGQHMLVMGRAAHPEIKRLLSRAARPGISANASSLRMIFCLLSVPELINRPYREIAAAAGVALGAVGSVLDDLRERGHLAGTDGRRLLDRAALEDEWAINYPLRLLPKLNVQRFAAGDSSWWHHAELPNGQAWWSGEVAAATLTGGIRPGAQTLYVEPTARPALTMDLAKRHRLRADSSGAVEVIDAFWHFDGRGTTTAPPLLVYADLLRTREPRNAEVAALLRDKLGRGE